VEPLAGNHQPISLTPFEQVIYVGYLRPDAATWLNMRFWNVGNFLGS
jgi:hypothetical protein